MEEASRKYYFYFSIEELRWKNGRKCFSLKKDEGRRGKRREQIVGLSLTNGYYKYFVSRSWCLQNVLKKKKKKKIMHESRVMHNAHK